VDELGDEKIDIVNWDENPGNLIQNALSPAQTVAVFADPDEKSAKVVVPDDQLSLAIGKEGQNARLAAKLTDYKIDIKSESQAVDAEGFRYSDYFDDEEEYGYDENVYYDENGNPIYDESAYVDDGSYAVEDTEEAPAEDVVAEGDGTEGSDE
jgi:N utilization substance protein A